MDVGRKEYIKLSAQLLLSIVLLILVLHFGLQRKSQVEEGMNSHTLIQDQTHYISEARK